MDASSYEGSSTVLDATLNFIGSLIGAGIIGYGSAIAKAGGLVSLAAIIIFATMNKYAFDLVIALSIETQRSTSSFSVSFENLGYAAFGTAGRLSVVVSKGLLIFGCLVVYIVVFKDNFSPSLLHLMYSHGNVADPTAYTSNWLAVLIQDSYLTTTVGTTLIIFPLILMRDVTPLARFSVVKLTIFGFVLCFLVHLFLINNSAEQEMTVSPWSIEGVHNNWLSVHAGVIGSLGTFLFGFTAQHTVNIVFESLKPELRTLDNWKKVSTRSTIVATAACVTVGYLVYMTFWERADSNMFMLYQPTVAVDVARLLLGISTLLTYPLPFFSLRELLISVVSGSAEEAAIAIADADTAEYASQDIETQGLLLLSNSVRKPIDIQRHNRCWWLIPGEDSQLIPSVHWTVTTTIYLASLTLALHARSLGDVLNLVGCATGTAIAFILPAIFSFRLKGYSHFSAFILLVGGSVGSLGTFLSLKAMLYGGY